MVGTAEVAVKEVDEVDEVAKVEVEAAARSAARSPPPL